MIKRFLPTETTYNHNKYILKPLRAEIVEEANGMFELEIELPKGTQLNKRDIITAPTPRGVQPFRVYRITKTLQGIKAYARHIFYDLANALLLDVRPTNTNGNGALQAIINAVGWSGWSYLSDITDLRTAYYIRKNPVEAIIGAENSILNTWGGNLIRDGKEVRINATGIDRGYEIRLGKNLIGIEDDSDDSNVVTRLYPTFERNQVIYGIPEGYIDSPLVGNYPTPIAKEIRVALTDEQKELPDADIYDILRAFCNNLYSVDNVDKPVVNYKIDFVQLAKVARIAQERKYTYAGLEQLTYATIQTLTYGELQSVNVIEQFTDLLEKVDLYDLVKIKVKELDIDLQARVISYRYDCLGERYANIELGGFKSSAKYQTSNIVQQIKNEREKASDKFRELYDLAINKVTGNAGGYQITRRNANNEPYETLWMDTPDIQTAQKVLRINQNGIAGSANGFNGPYSVAITTDGYVVAERILANQLSAISANLGTVTAGRIEDGSGVNYWDLNTGDMNLNELKIAGKKVSVSLSEIDGDIFALETTAQGLALDVAAADGRALNAQATADGISIEVTKKGSELLNQEYQRNTGVGLVLSNSYYVAPASVGRNDGINRIGILGSKNCTSQYFPHVPKSVYRLSVKDAYREHPSDNSPLLIGLEFWDDMGVSTIENQGTQYIASITQRYQWVGEKSIVIDTSGFPDSFHRCKYVRIRVLTFWNTSPSNAYTYIEGLSLRREGQANSIYGNTYSLDGIGFNMKDSNGSALITPNGVANEQNIGRVDNVEAGYPMKIPFHIGSEVSQITQAVLKWDMSQFRTYSKGAASGGGTKTTPSGGAGTAGTTWGSSGVAEATSSVTAGTLPHQHTIALSKLAHSHSTPAHTHSVDITHSHDPVFGILETGITVDYIVGITIDGVYRAQVNATRGEIDLSAWITTNGWHELILSVNGIKRLDANLFLKTYIRR